MSSTTYSKFVKSLQVQIWPVNFTNFLNLIFGFRFRLCQALHYIFKICQKYDPSISRIFLNLIFGGFLTFGATVYRRRRLRLYGSTSGDRCDGFTHTGGRHWRPRTSVRHKASSLYTYTRTCICFGLSPTNMKSSLSNWRFWKKPANFEKKNPLASFWIIIWRSH